MLNYPTNSTGTLHVAEVAQESKVTPATVRFYARSGLIHPRREADNGYRCFSGSDVRRITFIRRAKKLGLTIDDIKTILGAIDRGEVPCSEVKSMVGHRLAQIRSQIAELEAKEERILRAVSVWEQMDEQTLVNGEWCPLIERLDK
jgi:DNA-binding transcriptional MerR regulator